MNLANLRKIQAASEAPAPAPEPEVEADEVDPASLLVTNNAPLPEKAPVIPPGVTGKMAALIASKQNQAGEDPAEFGEVRRIVNLDVLGPFTPAEVEEFSRRNVLADAFHNGVKGGAPFRLHECQARGVYYFDRFGGLFGPLGCASGKTLLSLMIAERYWRRTAVANQGKPGARNTSLLLIPSEVYDQLTKRIGERPSDIQWARLRVPLTVPFIGLDGTDVDKRLHLAKTMNGCFVMPHQLMSVPTTVKVLEAMQPGLVQVDEAHKFKNKDRARTSRLMKYLAKKKPKFVSLSGSITNKSLKNHHHFLEPALGQLSPLPIPEAHMKEWAAVVDSDADPTDEMKKAMDPVVDWARFKYSKVNFRQDVSGFRLAQKLRMLSAPGVVATQDAPAPCPLVIKTIRVPHVVPEQEDMLNQVVAQVEAMTSPNGDPIEDARQKFTWLYQLSAGFYYKLLWPTEEQLAQRGYSVLEAKDVLKRSLDDFKAHRIYSRELREWFSLNPHAMDATGRPLDTPFLVGQEMLRYYRAARDHVAGQPEPRLAVDSMLYQLWVEWKKAGVEPGIDPFSKGAKDDLIERDSKPIPLSDYKIRAARDFIRAFRANKEEGGTQKSGMLVWYHHQHVGEWLYKVLKADPEIFAEAGGPDGQFGVLHCPAGDEANRAILDPANKGKIVVCGGSHKTGKNLQHFEHQLIMQWPRPANDLEQLLSRTHRPGQMADELVIHVLVGESRVKVAGTDDKPRAADCFDEKTIAASMRDATYAQQIIGNRQRALIAQWVPLPNMFDQNTLLEMGFDVSKLDARSEAFLKEKFG